jgi:hypothetical protein
MADYVRLTKKCVGCRKATQNRSRLCNVCLAGLGKLSSDELDCLDKQWWVESGDAPMPSEPKIIHMPRSHYAKFGVVPLEL